MILALDTNVLIDLWGNTAQGVVNAQTLSALRTGGHRFVVCGAVYAELHAQPGVTQAALDAALGRLSVPVDPDMSLAAWQEAGRAHAAACARRRQQGLAQPRRPLADHLIGAHAQTRTGGLITRNIGDFGDFSALTVVPV